jgi:hypothetical protein
MTMTIAGVSASDLLGPASSGLSRASLGKKSGQREGVPFSFRQPVTAGTVAIPVFPNSLFPKLLRERLQDRLILG